MIELDTSAVLAVTGRGDIENSVCVYHLEFGFKTFKCEPISRIKTKSSGALSFSLQLLDY